MNVRSRAVLMSLSLLTLVLRAPVSRAQSPTDSSVIVRPVASAPTVQNIGPTRDALSVAVKQSVPPLTSPSAASSAGLSQPQALMIVGGAAILVGAIVGDTAGDVFMVGGAIVGLYGLYKYLQ